MSFPFFCEIGKEYSPALLSFSIFVTWGKDMPPAPAQKIPPGHTISSGTVV